MDQVARLKAVRSTRDAARHGRALKLLARAAADGANLMPHIVESVRSYATVGEICGALKPAFGEYREQSVL